MGNQGHPGNQNRQDDQRKPTGPSGRQTGNDVGDNDGAGRGEGNTPSGSRPIRHDDDEESGGLGNRTTNR